MSSIFPKQLGHMKWHFFVLIFMGLFCFVGPLFYTQDYHTQNLLLGAQPPSWQHVFGTDILGRDLLARLMYGGQISILIGMSAGLIATGIGLAVGSVSGFIGGNVDRFFMRFIDILYPLPFTLLVILIMALSGRHIGLLVVVMGCVKWLTMARIIRNRVMILKTSTFVECSHCMGQTPLKIWWKHIMPNLMSLMLVYGTLLIPNIILEEAFISFLGLGVQPPASSWGVLIFDGARYMEEYPWLLLFPGAFFSLTLCSLNALGDHLRSHFEEE